MYVTERQCNPQMPSRYYRCDWQVAYHHSPRILQWHERHAAAVSRGDGLHPNIHYSTYKGAIAFSHNLIICYA